MGLPMPDNDSQPTQNISGGVQISNSTVNANNIVGGDLIIADTLNLFGNIAPDQIQISSDKLREYEQTYLAQVRASCGRIKSERREDEGVPLENVFVMLEATPTASRDLQTDLPRTSQKDKESIPKKSLKISTTKMASLVNLRLSNISCAESGNASPTFLK